MKVRLIMEDHELAPPMLVEQAQAAIVNIIKGYGWRIAITVDDDAVTDASKRYWDWLQSQVGGPLPPDAR